MTDFTKDVFPVAARYCRKVFPRDEDKHADALSYCWYLWKDRTRDDLPAAWFARLACCAVMRGQASCGTRSHMTGIPDAWDYTRLSGEMASFPDRRPGTFRLVCARDTLAALEERCGVWSRRILALLRLGVTQRRAIGKALGRNRKWVERRLRRLARMIRHLQS